VVAGGLQDDGSIGDLPWASVFDPDMNMRAVGAIQARGFRAATEVVNRLLKTAGGIKADQSVSDSDDKPHAHGKAPDVDRFVETWQKMVGQVARSIRDSVAAPMGAASFDLGQVAASGEISVETDGAGTAAAEVWLHNRGATDLGKVRLRCSDLLAHDGSLIEAAAVRFEPDVVPMPARCSRGVTVEVDVGDDVVPAHYRGMLLADGYSDVWLPIALVVRSAAQ
jgi:hypothetical protein